MESEKINNRVSLINRKTNETWGRPKSYTVEFKNNVVELKDSGLSLRKISSQLDCSTSLVQRVLKSV